MRIIKQTNTQIVEVLKRDSEVLAKNPGRFLYYGPIARQGGTTDRNQLLPRGGASARNRAGKNDGMTL